MKTAKSGDMVTVRYDGFLSSGELFDSSQDTGPIEFQIGDNSVLAGFNNGIIGMRVGETREIILPPEEAYGLKKNELIETFPRSAFPEEMEIKPGLVLGIPMENDGQPQKIPAQVAAVDGEGVKLDFNHPLAGQEITYKATLDSISAGKKAPQPPMSTNTCTPSGCGGCTSCG